MGPGLVAMLTSPEDDHEWTHAPSQNLLAPPLRHAGDGIGRRSRRHARRAARRWKIWRSRLRSRTCRSGWTAEAQARRFPSKLRGREVRRGIILGPVSHNDYPPADKGASTRRRAAQVGSTCSPQSARQNPRGFSGALRQAVVLVVCAKHEGFYATATCSGIGRFMPTAYVALAVRKITRHASMRIAEEAFRLATAAARAFTVVHKRTCCASPTGVLKHPTVAARHRT